MTSATTPAPSAPGVEAALANLTAVITAARQQGTIDQEAEDLLHQADDLANALQENPRTRTRTTARTRTGATARARTRPRSWRSSSARSMS